jgi:hypothetical protein
MILTRDLHTPIGTYPAGTDLPEMYTTTHGTVIRLPALAGGRISWTIEVAR